MLKKIDRGKIFIHQAQDLFRCPFCHGGMEAQGTSLVCQNNHRFDLSKKGTVFFLKQNHLSGYTKEMFLPRGRMIRCGMYQPLLDVLGQWLPENARILDAGCGEGSFLAALPSDKIAAGIGFDLAKEGVYLATEHAGDNFWCTADLTNLPFADQSFDSILNIFSPSHYQEFQRVLKADGCLLKVIPASGYLQELRQAFYAEDKAAYSNQDVLAKLTEKMKIEKQERLTYRFAIPLERQLDLLEMSPLEWGVAPERKAFLQKNPLENITVDVLIVKGKKK